MEWAFSINHREFKNVRSNDKDTHISEFRNPWKKTTILLNSERCQKVKSDYVSKVINCTFTGVFAASGLNVVNIHRSGCSSWCRLAFECAYSVVLLSLSTVHLNATDITRTALNEIMPTNSLLAVLFLDACRIVLCLSCKQLSCAFRQKNIVHAALTDIGEIALAWPRNGKETV